jgi:disulfide bond formation protein DsbB
MLENLFLLNYISATGVLLLEVAIVLNIIFFLLADKKTINNLIDWKLNTFAFGMPINRYALLVIFVFSLLSSVMTLVYSEYFGIVPCALCWFERIFMYGIVVLSGLSLYRKEEKDILPYILLFSIFGALFALYHHVLQMSASITSHLPCPVSGGDCAKRIIFEYGHITFPWMAFVVFAFFIFIFFVCKSRDKGV